MLALSSDDNNNNNKKNAPIEVRTPFSLCLFSSYDTQSLDLGPLHFNTHLLSSPNIIEVKKHLARQLSDHAAERTSSKQSQIVLPIVPVTFHAARCARPLTRCVPRLRIAHFARGDCLTSDGSSDKSQFWDAYAFSDKKLDLRVAGRSLLSLCRYRIRRREPL